MLTTASYFISAVKLDLRNCEALEEVFRRVRTKTLDLENTGLEDDVSRTLIVSYVPDTGLFVLHLPNCKMIVNPRLKTKFENNVLRLVFIY